MIKTEKLPIINVKTEIFVTENAATLPNAASIALTSIVTIAARIGGKRMMPRNINPTYAISGNNSRTTFATAGSILVTG